MSHSETPGRGVAKALASFPPGEPVFEGVSFGEKLFDEIDRLLASRSCTEGRLELATTEQRLTCLIHRGAPYLAGLQDRDVFTRVPLVDFVVRSHQLPSPSCSLIRTDSPQVLMAAVHFCKRPMLQGSTRLVDPAHVLRTLAKERRDAALSFERSGRRTLLFLKGGVPARLYFGDPGDESEDGTLEDRVLAFAFAPASGPCQVEVFTDLRLDPDPEAGATFHELAESSKPAPPVDICLHYPDGRELRRRPYVGPEMIIGRDPSVGLFIDNLAVSRKHARIVWERGSFVIEDLGSANGTLVDEEAVSRTPITADSRIEIGKFGVSIYEHPTEPKVMDTMFVPTLHEEATAFLVGTGVSVEIVNDVILGKGEGVDVRAKGFRVQPVHARLSSADGVFELRCFGKGRVRVNGEATRAATLAFGDEIQIGRSRFRLARKGA